MSLYYDEIVFIVKPPAADSASFVRRCKSSSGFTGNREPVRSDRPESGVKSSPADRGGGRTRRHTSHGGRRAEASRAAASKSAAARGDAMSAPDSEPVISDRGGVRLGEPRRGVKPLSVYTLPNGRTKLLLCSGSVVNFVGDCIVNAANEECIGGGGLDAQISLEGGPELQSARLQLPILHEPRVRCPTGSAKLTVGGDLQASHVAHAVGPDYRRLTNQAKGDALLISAYESVLNVCAEKRTIKTIAFPPLSGGIFRGSKPLREVIEIGLDTIIKKAPEEIEEIYFVCYTEEEMKEANKAASRLGLDDSFSVSDFDSLMRDDPGAAKKYYDEKVDFVRTGEQYKTLYSYLVNKSVRSTWPDELLPHYLADVRERLLSRLEQQIGEKELVFLLSDALKA